MNGKQSPDSLKEGWLGKQGNYIKNWRPRWFQVTEGILSYYKEPLQVTLNNFRKRNQPISSCWQEVDL